MTQPPRTLWDEVEKRIQEWLKELEHLLQPRHPERARVPVPVRVRPDDPRRPQ